MADWDQWGNHILAELKRLSDGVDGLRVAAAVHHEACSRDIADLRNQTTREIATLNVKAGIWGLLAGLIPVLILIAVEWLKVKTPFQ